MVKPLFDVPDREQIRALVLEDQKKRELSMQQSVVPQPAPEAQPDTGGFLDSFTAPWGAAKDMQPNILQRTASYTKDVVSQGADQLLAESRSDANKGFMEILGESVGDGPSRDPFDIMNTVHLFSGVGRYLNSRYAAAVYNPEENKAAAEAYQQKAAEASIAANAVPMSPQAERFQQDFSSRPKPTGPGSSIKNFMLAFANDPVGGAALMAEVSARSAPLMALGITASAITRNPSIGAAFMGLGDATLERYTSPLDYLRSKGVDITDPEQLRKATNDDKLMAEAKNYGLDRAVFIGVTDWISGLAAAKELYTNPLGNMIAGAGVQAGLGGGGELGAQAYTKGLNNVDWNDVTMEGLAEFATAPIEMVGIGRQYLDGKKAGVKTSLEEVLRDAAAGNQGAIAALRQAGFTDEEIGQMTSRRAGAQQPAVEPDAEPAPAEPGAFDDAQSQIDEVTKGEAGAAPVKAAFAELNDSIRAENDANLSAADGDRSSLGPLERAIHDVTNAVWVDPTDPETHHMMDLAEENGRADLADFIASRAEVSAIPGNPFNASPEELAAAVKELRTRADAMHSSSSQTDNVSSATFNDLEENLRAEADAAVAANNNNSNVGGIEQAIRDAVVSPVHSHIQGSTMEIMAAAEEHGRADLANYVATRAERAAESMLTEPGVPKDSPKYESIKADLERRKEEALAGAADLRARADALAQNSVDAMAAKQKPPEEPLAGEPVPEEAVTTGSLENANNISKSRVWDTGRQLKLALQRAILDAVKGTNLLARTAENRAYLIKVGLKDALAALAQNANAIGWYDLKTRQALAVMSLVHPELATDETSRFAFTWALAVTSNGIKVDKNFELAEMVYSRWKASHKDPAKRVMPTDVKAGKAQKPINKSLQLFNDLSQAWGLTPLRLFMLSNFKAGDIKAMTGIMPTGEWATTDVRGASVIGPKIGNGFFSNLYGKFDALTMDRWLVRTWGRWTGTLIEIDQANVDLSRTRLREALKGLDRAALIKALRDVTKEKTNKKTGVTTVSEVKPGDREKLISALRELEFGRGKGVLEAVSDSAIDALSDAILRASQEPKFREAMNGVKGGEELRKAGNSLAKYLDGQKEQPEGPGERVYIREIFSEMLKELQQDPRYKDLTMSDLQAVLWYAEKRLYETAKEDLVAEDIAKLEGDEVVGYDDDEAPDYANAAAAVAREKGISDRRINAALKKEEDRGRSDTAQPGARSAGPGEGGQTGQGQQGQARGFTPGERREFVQRRALDRVRSNRSGDAQSSWSYAREGGGDGASPRVLAKLGKTLGATVSAVWTPGKGLSRVFGRAEIKTPDVYELEKGSAENAARFVSAITEARQTLGPVGEAVHIYPVEDYQNHRLFLIDGGKAGFALKDDGDIVSVFSSKGTGAGRAIMEVAIAAGGRKLDCFHTILPEFYSAHGFRGVSRLLWNDEVARESMPNWDKKALADYNGGEPDVVFMVYDPDYQGSYDPKETRLFKGDPEKDYDRAVNAQTKAMREVKARVDANDPDIEAMQAQVSQLKTWKDESPLKTTEQLTTAAAAEKPAFDQKLQAITDELGIGYKDGPLKKADRIDEKIRDKFYPSAAYVTDAVRSSIYPDTPAQADEAVDKIKATFGDVIDEGWYVNHVGYADRKVLIKLPSGVIAEVQILEQSLADAKDHKGGHDLYKKARALDPSDPEVAKLEQAQKELYQPLLGALPADWKAAFGIGGVSGNSFASASGDTTRALNPTSAEFTRSQAPSTNAQASPGVQYEGRPSQTPGAGSVVGGSIAINGSDAQSVPDVNSESFIPRQAGIGVSGEPRRPAGGIASNGQSQEQISLTKMTNNLVLLMNLIFRSGKVTAGKNSLAQYNRNSGVIRARQRNDFSSLAHESGHALNDARSAELNRMIDVHQGEITQMALTHYGAPQGLQPPQLKREGFAEFFRLYVTNPQLAMQQAPNFYRDFDSFLRTTDPNLHKGLQQLARQAKAYAETYPSTDVVKSFVQSAKEKNLWDPRDLKDVIAEESSNARPHEGKPTVGGFFDWVRRGMFDMSSRAYTALVDRNNGVRKMTYALLNVADANGKKVDLKDSQNPLELLAKAANSFLPAQLQLQYGVRPYGEVTPQGPSLRDGIAVMMGAGRGAAYFDMNEARLADANAYLVALRALEEFQRFRAGEIDNPPVGFSEGDARQAVQEFEAKYGQDFINGAKLVHQYARNLLDKEFAAGLISPETYDEIKDKQNYVPLLRDMSDKNKEFGSSVLTSGKSSIIKRFRGSSRDIIAPLDALMHRTFATEKRIAENETVRAMAKLAQKAGRGAGAIVEKVSAHELERIQLKMEEVFQKIVDDPNISRADAAIMEGIFQASFGGDEVMSIFRSAVANERGERILTYRDGGKLQAIQLGDDGIGESVFNVMRGLGQDKVPLLLDLVSRPSRALRFGITKWPDFLLVNYFRDQFMASVSTNVGYIPFASGAKGMWDVVRRKKAYMDYSAAMGIMGGVAEYQIHKARVAKDIEGLKQRGYGVETFEFDGFSYKSLAGLVKGIFRLSELSEAGTRVGLFSKAYQRAIKEGLSEYDAIQEASRIARDYMDFGRVGSKMGPANRLIPFLNANIQGLDVTIRKLSGGGAVGRKALAFMEENRTAPRLQAFVQTISAITDGQRKKLNLSRVEMNDLKNAQAMWVKMMGLALMSAALAFSYKDDPDYQEASEYLRQSGWLIPLGNGKLFYIPKPFEISLLGNMLERSIEYAYGDEKGLTKFWDNFVNTVTPPFIPPAVSIPVGVGANIDLSFGKPREIVPGYMDRLPPEQRALATTSEVAKMLGEALHYPPTKIDFLITSLFGSMGRDVASMSDTLLNPDRAEKGVDDSFITRRFIRDANRGGMSSQDFNELANRMNGSLTQASAGYKRYMDVGDEAGAAEYLANLTDDEKAWAILDRNFETKFKRLHPIYRANQVGTIISGMRREVLTAQLKDTESEGEVIPLTAKEKMLVDDFLTDIQRRERRNALIAIGHPSWKTKKPLPIEPSMNLLREISPGAADELERRMAKAKVYDGADVAAGWPELKQRLLQDGPDAVLTDLTP